MKNISKSTGYIIVILFWLTTALLLSSCSTTKLSCGGTYVNKKLGN